MYLLISNYVTRVTILKIILKIMNVNHVKEGKTALNCALTTVQKSFLTADHDSWLAWLFLPTFYLRLTPL